MFFGSFGLDIQVCIELCTQSTSTFNTFLTHSLTHFIPILLLINIALFYSKIHRKMVSVYYIIEFVAAGIYMMVI